MKKTIKYTQKHTNLPYNFRAISSRNSPHALKRGGGGNDYFIVELSASLYENNSRFYYDYFKALVDREDREAEVKIYEWKEFLLSMFYAYQKTTKQKLIPRARASAIKVFLEDFDTNIKGLNNLDKEFKFTSKADKVFYLKKENKTFLLGFLVDKGLFVTFPRIISHLVNKYLSPFSGVSSSNAGGLCIPNFHDYFLFAMYQRWGKEMGDGKVKREEVTIGTDPEFLIYKKYKKNPKIADYRKLQQASSIISSAHSNDELGLDGCSELGELRPRPSTSPHILTRNIKKLFNKFYSEHGGNWFIETGGGCENSIGGHIHMGHEIFKNFTQAQIKPLMQLLDAFLYYPIKLNMYGAVREWRDFNELNVEIDYDRGECSVDEDPEKIVQTIRGVKPLKSQQFNGYDLKSQCRSQPHGLEYRSLPSFIGDFTFTKLVFKLAKSIAEKYIELRTHNTQFTYNDPPQKEDYLVFLKEKEVNQLFEYLYGKKKDLFLRNTLDNWKVIKQFFINISDNLNILDFSPSFVDGESLVRSNLETTMTKQFQSKLINDNSSLHVFILPSNHYRQATKWKSLVHPSFLITKNVNLSTMTKIEVGKFLNIPIKDTIYIGIPYIWRDRGYISLTLMRKIIEESIQTFYSFKKKRGKFMVDQSIEDIKKIPEYRESCLCQIADEIHAYGKVFKKKDNKPTQKKPKQPEEPERATNETGWDSPTNYRMIMNDDLAPTPSMPSIGDYIRVNSLLEEDSAEGDSNE